MAPRWAFSSLRNISKPDPEQTSRQCNKNHFASKPWHPAEGLMRSNRDSEIQLACDAALVEHRLSRSDLLATFLFGSSAKGTSKAGSDVDLIMFVDDKPDYPDFSYRRFRASGVGVDSNLLKVRSLNQVCRADVGWAYRLHRPQPIEQFSKIPVSTLDAWINDIGVMIESEAACRFRLLRHIRDCRALLRGSRQFANLDPGAASYLMVEAAFVVPIIFLNFCHIVPFQDDIPWNEALRIPDSGGSNAGEYRALARQIAHSEPFSDLARGGSFSSGLKALRDECRTVVLQRQGNIIGNGYRLLLDALRRDDVLRRAIGRLVNGMSGGDDLLIKDIWHWTNKLRTKESVRKLPARGRTPVRPKRNQELAPRHVQYEESSSRLKIILPTGGCRVPTCTFCMLPALARAKADIHETMTSIASTYRPKSVRQLSIYTDGSYFDDRELDKDERELIARTAKELGAEELLVESLPRFLNRTHVADTIELLGPRCRLRIGVGIQSTDASVRRYVTRTPITQVELRALLEWRKGGPFSLRCYLLANKPMMSATEDREDLRRSLLFLDQWLTEEDTVTVNPLLPTEGTVVENLSKSGLWRPLQLHEVRALYDDLRTEKYRFRTELGAVQVATCTDLDLNPPHSAGDAGAFSAADHFVPGPNDPANLPWSILGGMRHRNHWATKGRFAAFKRRAASESRNLAILGVALS